MQIDLNQLKSDITNVSDEIVEWFKVNKDPNFYVGSFVLDDSPRRKSHRGGLYNGGKPGINLSTELLRVTQLDWFMFYEYPSFRYPIGSFYSNDPNDYYKALCAHEWTHAYLRFKEKWYELPRSAPHGKEFQIQYAELRKTLVNPYLPDQYLAKENYQKLCKSHSNI